MLSMYYQIPVPNIACFKSTKWMDFGFIIIYAIGWNMPSTVWLNYHTYFQTTTCTSGTNLFAKIISVHVQYHNKLSILHTN